jgi:lactoylglutathione lyase
MKIDHVALYVKDLEGTKEFYKKYFGATAISKYNNPKTGLETYFLIFDGEERLEIMTRPELHENQKNAMQYGYIHLSFSVGSKQKVDDLTHLLKSDGYIVISEPRTTGDGYYESCVLDAENNQIEIVE